MKLPFKLPFGKKEKAQYFLSLVLRDEKVSAVIFKEDLGKVKIVAEQEELFKDSIEKVSLEELIEILDKAISKAESQLPSQLETQKTIFGVKEDWVLQSRIKKEYLVKLKKISDVFGLVPLGFLVISEAITHLLDKEEGAPVSALLIEVGQKNITVSLIRAGKIIEVRNSPIEESIAHTADLILHHLDYEVLPSRIILFDGGKEDLTQEFIGHQWSKSLPFLHVPKVSTLPKRFDAKAVMFGAVSQMGFEILEQTGNKTKKVDEVLTPEKDFEKEKSEEIENFGFLENFDIAKNNEDRLTLDNPKEELGKETMLEEETEKSEKNEKIYFLFSLLKNLKLLKRINLPKVNFSFIKKISLPAKKRVIFIPPIIIACLILLFVGYIFFVKATVTIFLNPKITENDQDITFTVSDSSINLAQKSIPAEIVTVTKEGSLSTATTGKKEVGDQAKGTVTIYSSLSNNQTFSKGTVITSSNGLEFTLDDNAKVASSSGVSDVQTVKVPVTADDIGKEYNLPSGMKFSMASFDTSNVEVKNDAAFSGGSKKEITVVSKNDLDKLSGQIPKELETKAKDEISKKITDDKSLLAIPLKADFVKKESDAKQNEEAQTVSLKATIEYQGFAYKNNDLEELAKKLLADKIGNFEAAKNGLSVSLKDIKEEDDKKITASLHVRAGLLPKIDKESIVKEIVGLSFSNAKATIAKLPQVASVDITLRPFLPFMPQMLPKIKKNITVIISSDE